MANKFLVLYFIASISYPNGIFPTLAAERQYQTDYDDDYPVYGPRRPPGAMSRSFLRAEPSAASPAPTQYMKNTKCFNCMTESNDNSGNSMNCDGDLTGRNTSFPVEYVSIMCKKGCHFTHYTYPETSGKGPRIYRACAENNRVSPYFGNEEFNCKKLNEGSLETFSATCVCIRHFCNKASKEEIGRLKTEEPYKSIPINVWFPFGELSTPTEPTTSTSTSTTTAPTTTTRPTTTSTTTAPPTTSTTTPPTSTTPATTTSIPTTQTTTIPTTVTTRTTTQSVTTTMSTTTLSQKPSTAEATSVATAPSMSSVNPAPFTTTKPPEPFATSKNPDPLATTRNPDPFLTTRNPNLFTTSKTPDALETLGSSYIVGTTKDPNQFSTSKNPFATGAGATAPGWANITSQDSAGVLNSNLPSGMKVVAVHKHFFYKPVYPASLRALLPGPFPPPLYGPLNAPGSRKDIIYG